MYLLCLVVLVSLACAQDWQLTQHLATKSPYFSPSFYPAPKGSNCSLVHIQLVARHGARNPTDGDVVKLSALEKAIADNRAIINASNYPWIFTWKNPFSLGTSGELLPTGELEHFNLAQRLRSRFPEILGQKYNSKDFIIQTTYVPRAAQSANSFAYGLWMSQGPLPGGYQPFWTYSLSPTQDDSLRFFSNCAYYKKVKNSPEAQFQPAAYEKKIVPSIADALLQRLGSQRNWITNDLVDAMYSACAFEVSAFSDETKWCTLFDQDSIDQLEFWEDLSAYWQKGYGFNINYAMGCVLVTDLLNTFDAKLKGNSQLGYLRFAHAETVIPLIAILGLYKDDAGIMAWNATQQQILNRKFRTSDFSSFASNVVFALSTCDSGPTVTVFSNEVPMLIPGCPAIECPYDTFKSLFSSYYQCDFNKVCSIPTDH